MSTQEKRELTVSENLRRAREKARGACMRRSREHYQRMQRLGVEAARKRRIERGRAALAADDAKKNAEQNATVQGFAQIVAQ